MTLKDNSQSFYLFDIDDNLLFLSTRLYLWNSELQKEEEVSSGEFAAIQNQLGRPGKWQSWSTRKESFRNFRDLEDVPPQDQPFVKEIEAITKSGVNWKGPSWPLLVHAATAKRGSAIITARGHAPETIRAGLQKLVDLGHLPGVPPMLGIYPVTHPEIATRLGVTDPATTVPSIKKLAIRHAVAQALTLHGKEPPHRFGMSDDDPNNVVLAISAMRDCKRDYPDKRFFVINTNHEEFVKLEIFPMSDPVTTHKEGGGVLRELPPGRLLCGGNASVYVSDMDRSVRFYEETLGLPLKVRIGNEWAEFDAGRGLVIGLHPASKPRTPAAGTIGAINIELAVVGSLDTVVQDLKSRGVTFKGPIDDYENVRLATFFDPDQNAIIIAQVLHDGTTK